MLEQETQVLASEHDDSMCLLKRQISRAWDFKQGLFGENCGPVLTFALFLKQPKGAWLLGFPSVLQSLPTPGGQPSFPEGD